MKASSKLLKPLSVTGLSLALALGCTLQLQGQQSSRTSGAFKTPAAAADLNTQTLSPIPARQAGASNNALLQARQMLAKGDVSAAKGLVEQARQQPIDSSINADTPAKVEAMIARHSQLMQMYNSGSGQDYDSGAAMFLLEQADGLLAYRDFASARALITDAKRFNVQYKPGDLSPDHILDRMQKMGALATATTATNMNPNKAEAGRILAEAQLALDKGQLDMASQLLSQVKAMNLPENVYEAESILPWELELKIQQARTSAAIAAKAPNAGNTIQQADYYPELDTTRNMQVNGSEEDPFRGNDARAQRLYDSGLTALSMKDQKGAMEYFRMAWQYRDQPG